MSEGVQRKAEDLFQAALELPQSQRTAFLDRQCGADDELLSEVKSLLGAHGSAQSFMESPAAQNLFGVAPFTPPGVEDDTHRLRPGDMVGPYKLRELLGEGGLGMVYLADQETPIRRRVAVKVIKLGMDTRQVVARFQAERQALAMMNHPHVAKVFDAGTTDRGRPYFVMEYVAGVPITDYCDRHRLGTRQRLAVFIDVCEALQHAHQKGIIHRDIKPSNVLVAVQDNKAVPKVIDFGIAKAVSQRLSEQTIFTEQGQLIGTPEYASPEQVEMSGLNIDTRTDVYSLGVLLYELLTGTLPFDSRKLREGNVADIQRIIREDEPPKLSTRVSTLGDDLTLVAKNRGCDPPTLSKQLRGDLDWITLKAMDKDRTRRYASASELAAEIRRYLKYEPVLAGPPSALYRMKKFARRNRAFVGSAVVVVVVLAAAVVSTMTALRRESRQRVVAERALREAKTVSEFLTDMISAPDPYTTKLAGGVAREVRMLDVLNAAEKKIALLLTDQPDVEATVRTAFGNTYRNLGVYDKAERHLTEALRLRLDHYGTAHAASLQAMNNLGLLRREQGRLDAAESLFRKSLTACRQTLEPRAVLTLNTMAELAGVQYLRDELVESESLAREVISVVGNSSGKNSEALQQAGTVLAFLLHDRQEFPEAERLYRSVLHSMRTVHGEDHPLTWDAVSNLALVLKDQQRYDEAEPLYLATLEACRRALGENHSETLKSMNNFAVFLKTRGKLDEAQRVYRDVLQRSRQTRGDSDPETLVVMINLAALLRTMGRSDEAEQLYRQALALSRSVEDRGTTLIALNSLAALLQSQDRATEALPLMREVYDTRVSTLGKRHPQTVFAMRRLANCLLSAGLSEEAASMFRRVLDVRMELSGKNNQETAVELNNLAKALEELDRHGEAEQLRRQSVAIMESLRPEFWLTDAFRVNLALCLAQLGNMEESCPLMRAGYAALVSKLGPDDVQTQSTKERIEELCAAPDAHRLDCFCSLLDEKTTD